MRALLVLAVLSLLPGCVTTRLQESADLYRWRYVGTDELRSPVAAVVRLAPSGTPYGVRLRYVTDKGEIVDYEEARSGATRLEVSDKGFHAPSELHRTGNTTVLVVESDEAALELGTTVRRAPAEGGDLVPVVLGAEDARTATIVLVGKHGVTVLAAPPDGRPVEGTRVSLLRDKGRAFELEPPRRGAWVVSGRELVTFYSCVPFTLLMDVVTFPVSVTGLLLHYAEHEGDDPLVGHHFHRQRPWEPPQPGVPKLPSKDASE